MTLKAYLWGMRISWAVTLIAWGLVLTHIDPEKSGAPGWLLFYVSFFLLLASTFALLLIWIWHHWQKDEDAAMMYIGTSFRQGALLALLFVGLLFLQQYRVLTWWDGALSVAGIFLIELYFLTRNGS